MHGTCDKCKSKENYNFVINNGLCDPCIEARLDELEEDNRHRACLELDATGAILTQKKRIAGLKAELEKQGWIRVDAVLPEDDSQVWIWYEGTAYTYVAYYDKEYNIWYIFNYGGVGYIMADKAPTHWKPIYLPQKDNNGR